MFGKHLVGGGTADGACRRADVSRCPAGRTEQGGCGSPKCVKSEVVSDLQRAVGLFGVGTAKAVEAARAVLNKIVGANGEAALENAKLNEEFGKEIVALWDKAPTEVKAGAAFVGAVNSLFKTGFIRGPRQGLRRSVDDVELATPGLAALAGTPAASTATSTTSAPTSSKPPTLRDRATRPARKTKTFSLREAVRMFVGVAPSLSSPAVGVCGQVPSDSSRRMGTFAANSGAATSYCCRTMHVAANSAPGRQGRESWDEPSAVIGTAGSTPREPRFREIRMIRCSKPSCLTRLPVGNRY